MTIKQQVVEVEVINVEFAVYRERFSGFYIVRQINCADNPRLTTFGWHHPKFHVGHTAVVLLMLLYRMTIFTESIHYWCTEMS